MERLYEKILGEHNDDLRQMAFLAEPRQVGKTTTAQAALSEVEASLYLNWNVQHHQQIILGGTDAVADECGLQHLAVGRPTIIFDEIHKYPKWKLFLKGFFDVYSSRCRIIVTGSGRLNAYSHGGDSLMGRYFLYRMHQPDSYGWHCSASC